MRAPPATHLTLPLFKKHIQQVHLQRFQVRHVHQRLFQREMPTFEWQLCSSSRSPPTCTKCLAHPWLGMAEEVRERNKGNTHERTKGSTQSHVTGGSDRLPTYLHAFLFPWHFAEESIKVRAKTSVHHGECQHSHLCHVVRNDILLLDENAQILSQTFFPGLHIRDKW